MSVHVDQQERLQAVGVAHKTKTPAAQKDGICSNTVGDYHLQISSGLTVESQRL